MKEGFALRAIRQILSMFDLEPRLKGQVGDLKSSSVGNHFAIGQAMKESNGRTDGTDKVRIQLLKQMIICMVDKYTFQ